jgi:hypothetical protein
VTAAEPLVADTHDWALRRHSYLPLFAELYHFTPSQVDALDLADFDLLCRAIDVRRHQDS